MAKELSSDTLISLLGKRWQFMTSLEKLSQSSTLKFFHTQLFSDLLATVHKQVMTTLVQNLQIVSKVIGMIHRKRIEKNKSYMKTDYNLSHVYSKLTDNMKTQMKRLFDTKSNESMVVQSPLQKSLLRSSTQKYFLV